jgi:hypothetical protein
VVGLVGGAAAVAVVFPTVNSDECDQRQKDRELKEQAEEDALEAGLPLKLAPGVS